MASRVRTPLVILAILAGLGWLTYAFSAPDSQPPTVMHGTVAGFRLGEASRVRGEPRAVVVVALRDGTRTEVAIPVTGAAACHIGDAITLDQYTNHLGSRFLRAGAHACG